MSLLLSQLGSRGDFPTTSKGFVNGDQPGGGAGLALGELGLDIELGPFSVKHRKKIGHSAFVSVAGQGI